MQRSAERVMLGSKTFVTSIDTYNFVPLFKKKFRSMEQNLGDLLSSFMNELNKIKISWDLKMDQHRGANERKYCVTTENILSLKKK